MRHIVRLISSVVVLVCILQFGLQATPVFAADSACNDPAASPSTGTISDCQQQLLKLGIYYFDATENMDDTGTCTVQVDPTLTGSDNVQISFNFLVAQGLSQQQAAGVVGNLMVESGGSIDPTAVNPTSGAFGIAQWLGGRYTNLKDFASKQGGDYKDLGIQLKFLWNELHTTETAVLPALEATSTPTDAAKSWEETFERAGGAGLSDREKNAEAVFAKYGSADQAAATSTAGDPNATTVPTDASGGCSNATDPGQDTQYVDGFTVYSQLDPAWADNPYGTSTIGASGCGPSAMAMVITALTGKKVTPADTTKYANSKNIYVPGSGSSWTVAPVLAKHWGLNATAITGNYIQKINATLQSGGMVVGSGQGPLPFTSAGHYIVIRALTSDGKWLIGDSAHKDTNTEKWDPQTIMASMHTGSLYAITK